MIRPRFFIENRSFFTTSDFFHADLLSDENGDWLHTFSALLAAATAAWHSLFHHGPRSSFGVVGGGDPVVWWRFRKDFAVRKQSSSEFHWGHFDFSKIQDDGLLIRRVG